MQNNDLTQEQIQQEIAYLQQQAELKRREQTRAESGLVNLVLKLMQEPHDFIWFAAKKLKEK